METVRSVLSDGRRAMAKAKGGEQLIGQRYAQTLARLDRVLKGWGDAFAYCNGRHVFEGLDQKVDIELAKFRAYGQRLARDATPTRRRRISGVYNLSDTPAKLLPATTDVRSQQGRAS